MNKEITFDSLPEAVTYLTEQVTAIKEMVSALHPPMPEEKSLIGIDDACVIIQKAKPTIYALRYRAIRMELGAREPSIAQLDSLFSAKDTEDSIARLRTRVLNYEQALERQAELLLQQQRLSEEQASLSRQLQH